MKDNQFRVLVALGFFIAMLNLSQLLRIMQLLEEATGNQPDSITVLGVILLALLVSFGAAVALIPVLGDTVKEWWKEE